MDSINYKPWYELTLGQGLELSDMRFKFKCVVTY